MRTDGGAERDARRTRSVARPGLLRGLRQPLALTHGPELIRAVGIVSGGGARNVHDAIAEWLDAFITGDPAEWGSAIARESRIRFLAAEHHATETFGPRALGEHLARRFGAAHTDIPMVNPV